MELLTNLHVCLIKPIPTLQNIHCVPILYLFCQIFCLIYPQHTAIFCRNILNMTISVNEVRFLTQPLSLNSLSSFA